MIAILKQMDPSNEFFEKFRLILKDEMLVYSNLIFN